jgi:hypothetical protein
LDIGTEKFSHVHVLAASSDDNVDVDASPEALPHLPSEDVNTAKPEIAFLISKLRRVVIIVLFCLLSIEVVKQK